MFPLLAQKRPPQFEQEAGLDLHVPLELAQPLEQFVVVNAFTHVLFFSTQLHDNELLP